MLLPELLLLLFAVAALISSFLCFSLYKQTSLSKKLLKEKEDEMKSKLYESNLFDNLHTRYGYSIHLRQIFDVVLTSISDLVPFTAASYLVIEGQKLVFRAYLHEKTSRSYIDQVKSGALQALRNINPLFITSPHLEESLSGNLVDIEDNQQVVFVYDIPLYIGNDLAGIFTISSSHENLAEKYTMSLINKIIERIMHEVSKLKELVDHEKTKLEVMVENMSDGVVMIDNDFRVMTINKSCVDMLGLPSAENVTIFDIVGFFSPLVPLEQRIATVFDKGDKVSILGIEIKNRFLDIFVIPVNGRVDVKGVGIIIQDKTKEVELNKLREDFTSMVVHELRSPLTVILDTADLLMKRYLELSKEQIQNLLVQVKKSSTSLLTIVSELLDLAKIEAGKMKITKKSGDLNNLLFERVEYYKHLAAQKNLALTINTDTTISPFNFDYMKIEQVLNNLLSNAIKFTETGGIKIVSKRVDGMVKVSVIDTGMGISDEDKNKLFNKFERLEAAEAGKQKGTGLGLVITKGIIEAHGGSVHVENNLPQGAVISFTLPMQS